MTTLDITKLSKLFTAVQVKQFEDILFYRNDDGSYNVFDAYHISREKNYYVVHKWGVAVEHMFSTLKYALCWCISSRRNKISTMTAIIDYDRKLSSLDVEIKIQRSLLNSVERDLYSVKLSENIMKRAIVQRRLQDIVQNCEHWQNTMFGRSVNLSEQ